MPQIIGQAVGHYEVLQRIGSGGMGEVYLARDTKLDRLAALKFLPSDLAEDRVARARLNREAQAVAALDNPFICKVYALNEYKGQSYLALEYIDGKTLQAVLRDGPLTIERVVTISSEICQALEEAHNKGIVHRDLKPSNLMFSSQGQVKVLDFGLAKRHDLVAETDAPLTDTGMAIGTIPYMSPEQLNGDELTPASDLFSLGTLLFEMFTGTHPFGRKVNMETAMAILTKKQPSMYRTGTAIPAHLRELVDSLLNKVAEERIGSAAEVLAVLRGETSVIGASEASPEADTVLYPQPGERTETVSRAEGATFKGRVAAQDSDPSAIAVLPFARLSPDPDDEFFCDGLADEITTALAKLRPIRVVARTSAFAFKGRNEDVRTIGSTLGVDALLQGSVRRAGSRVRIGVQLVSVADGSHLWSESFDRELVDVFAVQDEISQSVVATLRLRLGSGTLRAIAVPRASSLEAYELYLQAKHHVRSHTKQGVHQALRCYEDALALDGKYAPAIVGCAEAYVFLGFYAALPREVAFPKAKELVELARSIDPTVDSFHVFASVLAFWEWDFAGAERELRDGLDRVPNDASGQYTLSVIQAALGRRDESIATAESASALDPLNSTVSAQIGHAHFYARDFESAETCFRIAVAKHPADAMPAIGLGITLRELDRTEEALVVIEAAPAMLGGITEATIATCYAVLGREQEARSILEQFESAATNEMPIAFLRASVHMALGEKEQALDMLELSADQREGMIIWLAVQPGWDSVRDEPRFEELVKRIGLGGGPAPEFSA